MKQIDFEEALNSLSEMLREKVADYLDVNRQHIRITYIETDLVFENTWDELEEGEPDWFETYYSFGYQFRKKLDNKLYGEEVTMVWQHTRTTDVLFGTNFEDVVMTVEEFEELVDSHQSGNPMHYIRHKNPTLVIKTGSVKS